MTGPKADLHEYLRSARAAVLGKLEGLSEYDVRRPLVPTGAGMASGDVRAGDPGWWEGRRRRLEEVARRAGPA